MVHWLAHAFCVGDLFVGVLCWCAEVNLCGLLSSDGSGNGGSKSGVVEYPRCVLMYAQREGVSAGGAMRSAGEALLGANLIERGN